MALRQSFNLGRASQTRTPLARIASGSAIAPRPATQTAAPATRAFPSNRANPTSPAGTDPAYVRVLTALEPRRPGEHTY